MHSLNSRRRRCRSEEEEIGTGLTEHPLFSYATWVAAAVAGSALVGAGASLYGANKQSKDNRAAQDQNARLQQQQNDAGWVNWLMTRGVQPNAPVSAGTVPGAGGYTPVNTRLPLWANLTTTTPNPGGGAPGGPVVRRKTPRM